MKRKENKSQFIKRHPEVRAAALVELAQRAGITVSREYIHGVRSRLKAETANARPAVGALTVEDVLFAAAAELGFGHAIRLLETKRLALDRVLGRVTPDA